MKPTTLQVRQESQFLKRIRNVLFICGVLSSILYVSTDIFAAMMWRGYSYAAQSVSELMAIGAPTRSLVVLLFTFYNVLIIAFGIGVWASLNPKWTLRITGILLIGYGIVGQLALLFFPMHLRGGVKTISDTMHATLTMLIVIIILLFIGFGAAAHKRQFRLYSIITIIIMMLFGVLAGMDGPRVAAHLPTPWLGVMERINIYTSMLWVMVLALKLLRTKKLS